MQFSVGLQEWLYPILCGGSGASIFLSRGSMRVIIWGSGPPETEYTSVRALCRDV